MGRTRSMPRAALLWVATMITSACGGGGGSCDELAGAPMLSGSSGTIANYKDINTEKAIPACEAAVRDDPDDMLSTYLLARTLVAAERYDDAATPLGRAIEADYGPAFAMRGNIEFYALGQPKDAAAALASYRRAVELGYIAAASSVAWFHYSGTVVPRDQAKAARLYLQAAESGHSDSQARYAVLLMSGDGVERDDAAALEWVRRAEAQDDPYARYLLGFMHENGRGTDADAGKAVRWYRAAAEGGDNFGRTAYARMLEEGKGVDPDPERARAVYRDAASAENAEAQARLGRMLRTGEGGPVDLPAARSLLEAAGNQPVAVFQLGLMDWFGEAGRQDRRGGLARIRKAADSGHAEARVAAAKIMTTAEGGEPFRNTGAAVAYLRDAADQDHPDALFLLGERYIEGDGVPKNTTQGLAMLDKAASLGDEDAAEMAVLARKQIQLDKEIAELQRERCRLMIVKCNRGCETLDDGTTIYNTYDGTKWFKSTGQLIPASEAPDFGCPQQ